MSKTNGGGFRLRDHKDDKPREVKRYKPPRPLSWVGCLLLLFFAVLLLVYGGSLLLMRIAGTRVDALANTRIGAEGQAEQIEVVSRTTMLTYTYRDQNGTLHEHTDSLTGNEEAFDETIPVLYLPAIPDWSMLAFRASDMTTVLLCLFLGVILLWTGVSRLAFLRRKALGQLSEEEARKEEEQDKGSEKNRP